MPVFWLAVKAWQLSPLAEGVWKAMPQLAVAQQTPEPEQD
jgi:hypothetical protein